ncbi:MAG: lamin tail domain-containing protein [Flavobacteriaceae bacterium]|nr:lamin tail domain-containing protein [Flavobacteriaceae bacterium]
MKKKILAFLIIFSSLSAFSQVGINTTSPSPASVLDIESSSDNVNYGGFLPPRVSLVQRNLIPVTASDDGLMVYLIDGTTRCIQIYDGVDAAWEDIYCMPLNAAPVASLLQIAGIFQVGEILTASFTYSDAENDPEGTHTYTWYRADDASGTNQTQIQTGTSSTYTILPADLNSYIAFEVTPLATQGTLTGLSVLSSYDGPVTTASPTASNLFISEYVEGSSNNKLLEIANFTGSTVSLNNYMINIYFNGNGTPANIYSFPTGINLVHGDVYVIAHPNVASPCNSNIDDSDFDIDFNGNDVVELVTTLGGRIDIMGTIGDSSNYAQNTTLRKTAGTGPSTTYNAADYSIFSLDNCTDIGSHTF